MSLKFSSVVQVMDISDYILPEQECIKPPEVVMKKTDTKRRIEFEGSNATEDIKKEKPKKIEINLKDCLSCSGCITSAETILIQHQSADEVYKAIEDKIISEKNEQKVLVVSISPQSKASIAVKNNMPYEDASRKLTTFFKKIGFDIVLDTTIGREISLLESAKEFVELYKKQHDPSTEGQCHLPLLAASCPGWVCSVEKGMGENVLSHLSKVKSAQQMTASIVKGFLRQKLNLATPSSIYHVAVAPCFDRKLEASRSDFYSEEFECSDVDCVLSTDEVQDMLNKENTSLAELSEDTFNHCQEFLENTEDCWSHEKSESDGYLDYIARYATKELFNKELDTLKYKALRNKDMQEVIIYKDEDQMAANSSSSANGSTGSEKPLLCFALAYGSKNLQNVASKVRKNQSQYDYVEVMACPSGCINGVGQISIGSSLERVKQEYNSVVKKPVGNHPVVQRLYDEWLTKLSTEEFLKITRTQFRIVPKSASLKRSW